MPDSVLDIIRQFSRARSEGEIVGIVSQASRLLLHADGAALALRDGNQCHYAEDDAVSPLWKDRRLPMSGCIAGWCMANRQAIAVPDIHQDPRVFAAVYRPNFVRSLALAPVGDDEPVAAVVAYWSGLRQPQPDDLTRLQAIADGAALAMAKLQGRRPASPDPHPTAEPTISDPEKSSARRTGRLGPAVERLRQGLRLHAFQAYAVAVACVLVATLLRLGVEATGANGITIFSFYYPAILVALLVGGRRAGVLAAATGGLASAYLFIPPHFAFTLVRVADAINIAIYAVACGAIILTVDWYQRTLLLLKLEDARHLTLARETQHRARNAVSVVEAVLRQSLRGDLITARLINQRIRAAFADVDIRVRTRPVRAAALFINELEIFDLQRFFFEGDRAIMVAPEVSSILTLAAHELATNALKHGALSAPEGQVSVNWRTSDRRFIVCWREAGGPSVERPRTQGFGSVMLRRLVQTGGGTIVVDFPPTGVTAEISFPLDAVEVGVAPRWLSRSSVDDGASRSAPPEPTPI